MKRFHSVLLFWSGFLLYSGSKAETFLANGRRSILAGQSFVLGGPSPKGWTTKYANDLLDELFLGLHISSLIESDDIETQRRIFQSGIRADAPLTLKTVGIVANLFSASDPVYNFYIDAFDAIGADYEEEKQGYFDDRPVTEYASTVVDDLLSLHLPTDIIKESVLVMGIYMRIHTYMNNLLSVCSSSAAAAMDPIDALATLDHIATLWIGFGQSYGNNDNGSMFYNLAEKAGMNFNQDTGESTVNTALLTLMKQLRVIFETNINNAYNNLPCTEIRRKIVRLQSLALVPLVQNLIHHLWNNDSYFIELYALAIAPALRACDPTDFDYLMNQLVLQTFRFTSFDNVLTRLQSMYSCLGIRCDDVGAYSGDIVPMCMDGSVEPKIWGIYEPSKDVTKFAKVDRDLRQIDLLLKRNRTELFYDIFANGRNMNALNQTDDSPTTLKLMSMQISSRESDEFNFIPIFEKMYGENYSESLIEKAMKTNDTTSKPEIILRLLQTVTTPHYAFIKMLDAHKSCMNSTFDSAMLSWDMGSAVILGSTKKGDDSIPSGRFRTTWYTLAYEMCQHFGCNTTIGNLFQDRLILGKTNIVEGNCTEMLKQIKSLKSLLFVPLIQGALHFAIELENTSDPATIGAFYAFASSILPSIREANENAYRQMFKHLNGEGGGRYNDTLRAFARSWDALGIECTYIGIHLSWSYDFCALMDTIQAEILSPTMSPTVLYLPNTRVPTAPMSEFPVLHPTITFGRYTFTYNVTNEAAIALDIRDMYKSNNYSVAHEIYVKGTYSSHSIEGIVNETYNDSKSNPYYYFYRFALRTDPLFADRVDDYATAVLESAFQSSTGSSLAVEATVVTIFWMEVINKLYTAVNSCKDKSNPEHDIDSAVAYYVGALQTRGNTDGYLLYNFAQQFGERFRTVDNDGEANVNRYVMSSFSIIKDLARKCTLDIKGEYPTWLNIRKNVQDIVSFMNVPLLQALHYYLQEFSKSQALRDRNLLELYAIALLPQLATCNPDLYDYFQSSLIDDAEAMSPETIEEMVQRLRESYDCFGTDSSEVVGDSDYVGSFELNLAGFNVTFKASQYVFIDRDIMKIEALLNENAAWLAQEIYEFGFSTRDLTLRSMARDPNRRAPYLGISRNSEFLSFVKYFRDEFYADSSIMSEFNLLTTNAQIGSAEFMKSVTTILKTLQTMVFFMTALQHMYLAINQCEMGSSADSKLEWDRAGALVIGSLEGSQLGGTKPKIYGRSLYALAKGVCGFFGTCSVSGDALSNENLVEALLRGKVLLGKGLCDDARDITQYLLKPALLIPMIQSTVEFAIQSQSQGSGLNHTYAEAAGKVLCHSIVPLVYDIDESKAEAILTRLDNDASAVFTAFSNVLDRLHINCADVGKSDELDQDGCIEDQNNDSSTSGTIYTTKTDVGNWAKIDLDVKFMIEALSNGDNEIAKLVYSDGFNSLTFDNVGNRIGKRSIADLSLQASQEMSEEPTFNLYRFALADNDGMFMNSKVGTFGNTVVMSLFENKSVFLSKEDSILPVVAMVVLNVWPYVVHQLHTSLSLCKSGRTTDSSGVNVIDLAVSYWIGSLPLASNSTNGYLLYNLAEEGGDQFSLTNNNYQTQTNKNILGLLKQASLLLGSPGACQQGSNTHERLWAIITKAISQMSIPLIQHLISSLKRGDRERVRIYSLAVVPLVSICRKSVFEYLKKKLILSSYDNTDVEEIISRLQDTYSCLGISCSDIGLYRGDRGIQTCTEVSGFSRLAGYEPSADVHEIAKLDLDIREIEVMMTMGLPSAAEDLYKMGKHSSISVATGASFLSLYQLATDVRRKKVPEFASFKDYFSGDEIYAHNIINRVLHTNYFSGASVSQTATLLRYVLSYMVMHMSILTRLHDSLSLCETGDVAIARRSWDESAAMFIGSLEGADELGIANTDGYLIHGLANDLCLQFNVCEMGLAKVNELLKSWLRSGSAGIDAKQCAAVNGFVKNISYHLLVPLIQGSLLYAASNENLPIVTSDDDLAAGFVLSRSVLPYVKSLDEPSASLISRNLDFQMTSRHIPDGHSAVFQAFGKTVSLMDGLLECSSIGYLTAVRLGICPGVSGDLSSTHSKRQSLFRIFIITLVMMSVAAWIFFKYTVKGTGLIKSIFKRGGSKENKPIVVLSSGESC